MGLFDKLFGSSGNEVLNKIKDVANSAVKEAENAINTAVNSANTNNGGAASNAQPASTQAAAPASSDATSGDSWGPTMPAEDNQYNYNGPYDQYFMDIYTQYFPMYRVTSEKVRKGTATVITLWRGMTDDKALIVELMSENSTAYAICSKAKQENVPYLRFYYNHKGWWNTKSYVIRRVSAALGC